LSDLGVVGSEAPSVASVSARAVDTFDFRNTCSTLMKQGFSG
jgi:hypothetical protein